MEYSHIKIGIVEDRIGIITLNRPEKRNAISIRMRREISSSLAEWEGKESGIDIVIFTGAGSSFSAGFDLTEFGNPESFPELLDSSAKYHMDVWNFPKPTIAAINGPAMGGGFDLITFNDIRLCSETAVFGHPEIKFGAPPIYTPLRWVVGEGRARELCLTGRKISAQEAFQMGLVSQVTAPDELLDRAILMSKTILEAPMDTIGFTKAFLCGNSGKGFEESFGIEHDEAFQKILLPKAARGFK